MQEGIKIAVTDNELRNQANQRKYQGNSGDNDAAEACERLLRELPTPASLAVISIYYLQQGKSTCLTFFSLCCLTRFFDVHFFRSHTRSKKKYLWEFTLRILVCYLKYM
jgi:hypothetical protein